MVNFYKFAKVPPAKFSHDKILMDMSFRFCNTNVEVAIQCACKSTGWIKKNYYYFNIYLNDLTPTFIMHQITRNGFLKVSLTPGLKVDLMTRTIWVTSVTFLVGQMGLICKLNYLDVTQISHVL